MNSKTLFESFNSIENNEESVKFEELLNCLLTIKNPMHFTDKMGTDEEIENLIDHMKERDMLKINILRVKQNIRSALPKKSSTAIFI